MKARTLIAVALVSGAVLGGMACGSTAKQNSVSTVPTASNQAPITMQITNDHPQDVDVYVTDGGDRLRLGTVSTGQTQTFTVPAAATHAGSQLRVVVHPIGGGGDFSTGRVLVSPGDEVNLTVTPAIEQTMFSVSQR
jgi:hypothetical protein